MAAKTPESLSGLAALSHPALPVSAPPAPTLHTVTSLSYIIKLAADSLQTALLHAPVCSFIDTLPLARQLRMRCTEGQAQEHNAWLCSRACPAVLQNWQLLTPFFGQDKARPWIGLRIDTDGARGPEKQCQFVMTCEVVLEGVGETDRGSRGVGRRRGRSQGAAHPLSQIRHLIVIKRVVDLHEGVELQQRIVPLRPIADEDLLPLPPPTQPTPINNSLKRTIQRMQDLAPVCHTPRGRKP